MRFVCNAYLLRIGVTKKHNYGGPNMKNIQLAISGIAEDKEFHEALGMEPKTLKRTRLASFITRKLGVDKITFARMLGVSPAAVTKWLYTTTQPSYYTMKKMSNIFGLTFAEVEEFFK